MKEISIDEGVGLALDALMNDRLAILCGAGLSMAPPSNLPNAAALAAAAKRKHDARYGTSRPALPPGIEDQAEFFFRQGDLGTVYLRTYIDSNAFAGPPNPGHEAVADLLMVRGIQTAVSTNVDVMIETAGQMLFGQIGVGTCRDSVARLLPDVSPLLKVHGCWTLNPIETVWAPSQVLAEPLASRIAGSADWMETRLLDRDLIIVGYFTDWDYLNGVLERTLGRVRPARVIVVDPSDGTWLAAKAPSLHALGGRAGAAFLHVNASGADFLDSLRFAFSTSFVRGVLHGGAQAYEDMTGVTPDPAWMEPDHVDNNTLWRVRRDLEGRKPGQPAVARTPADEPALGLTLLQLRARGAIAEGPCWRIDGRRVRILRAANQMLHQVQAAYAREVPPLVAPDVTVAIGAEPSALPAHIVRAGSTGSIVRSSGGLWLTRPEAVTEFKL